MTTPALVLVLVLARASVGVGASTIPATTRPSSSARSGFSRAVASSAASAATMIGNTSEADLEGGPRAIATLRQRDRNVRVVVPGDGEPGGPELRAPTRELLGESLTRAQQRLGCRSTPGGPTAAQRRREPRRFVAPALDEHRGAHSATPGVSSKRVAERARLPSAAASGLARPLEVSPPRFARLARFPDGAEVRGIDSS
jgi:hypothetical protein